MLKRELKINKNSLIIWTSISLMLLLFAYIIYNNMMNSKNLEALNEMLKVMPEELLKMFNMDIVGIDTVFGWFKTEGYIFIALFTCLYSAILGSHILFKEESDKTIEFLHSKPITRNNIVTAKILAGLINIGIMFFIITIFNVTALSFYDNTDTKLFLILTIAPILSALPFFFITLFISTFFKKTSKTNGIGIGLVLINYFILMIANISEQTKFIKYFSIFSLSDSREIILNNNLSPISIIISILISIIAAFGIYYRYNKKDLV